MGVMQKLFGDLSRTLPHTRVEVIEHGRVVTSKTYGPEDYMDAQRDFGTLVLRGHHVRMVETGNFLTTDQTVAEAFNVMDDEGFHINPCPACGPICLSHNYTRAGRATIASHWVGDHETCNPLGCTEREE